jgi:DNA polymerase elongation subunit (family B)
MYQAVYFNRDKFSSNPYHYYLRDDKKGLMCFKYNPPVYKLDEEGEYETLFGDKCSIVEGKYDWDDESILEKDISKELAIIRDLYSDSDEIPSFHNIVYLDIEIEILGALTPYTIREANAEITAIALGKDDIKKCFILDKENKLNKTSNNNTEVIPCVNEKQLILAFLDEWEKMDPTIIVGYNSDFFDIPYLYYRLKKVVGDEVLRLSPVKLITENIYNPESPITIGLVNCLDFMLILKKFLMKEENSYKLGDIGLKFADLGKIEYNGSLDKLFKEDPIKFIEYNIRDIEIIEALENKLKFIELTILMSHICHTPYESIYYNTILNEGGILTYLKRKNIVAPNKPTTVNPSIKEIEEGDLIVNQRGTPTIEGIIHRIIDSSQVLILTKSGTLINRQIKSIRKKEGYAGGYLLEPLVGLHKWIFDEDVTSYYPFSIISLNIGIETFVCRIVSEHSTRELWMSLEELQELPPTIPITIEKLDLKTFKLIQAQILPQQLYKIIIKKKYTISANGCIYRTDKKSIAAEILLDWFDKRKEFKDKMKLAYQSGDKIMGSLYNNYQMSFKILLNSLYGSYAINSWRFTDGHKICSSSITTTGQRLISESIKFMNEEMKKELN